MYIKKYKEFVNESITDEKRFVVDNENYIFKLFLGNILVAESFFVVEEIGDDLFDQKYVGLFRLQTIKKYRGKGFMKYLLEQIFNYVKNELNINYILINVLKNNQNALNMYFKLGFKLFKDYNDYDWGDVKPFFSLIKKI